MRKGGSTACHELGHVLGLGHAATETCIMNGNRDRDLHTVYTPKAEDSTGVHALYDLSLFL